ncbi:MAG: alpha/beta hydrolase fold domain-containing protein [Actinobacteria bacterium]|nr:alpha/beta hydrolase fold domain-containing protein [Actinomycetota bacterium]
MYGLAASTGFEYAQRGYVGFSVEYRTDTTLVARYAGDPRPPSLCQWVQDNQSPGDPTWEARRLQCARNIVAAQRDALAAVRWIRANAARFGVDPAKIAVGGFSAGAVTALNVAYRSNDVGATRYFAGDDLSPIASRAQAALAASGCLYSFDGGPLTDIGAGDAPISAIHSKGDPAVPYSCIAATVTTARAKGLVAELSSYCTSSLHANKLYDATKQATDEQWTTFLARELPLYTGMRPPSTDPVCP